MKNIIFSALLLTSLSSFAQDVMTDPAYYTLQGNIYHDIVSSAGTAEASLPSNVYKLQSVTFEIEKVKNPRNSKEVPIDALWGGPPIFGNNGFMGISVTRDRILSGKIVIDEYNDALMSQRKTIIPAHLLMRAKGLTAGIKSTWNSSLEIHGMEGKKIQDLFIAVFGGGKFSLGVGLAVGLNPNYLSLSSPKGISIIDLESLLAVTGIGIQALSIEAEFKVAAPATQIINVVTQTGASIETKNTALNDALNKELN